MRFLFHICVMPAPAQPCGSCPAARHPLRGGAGAGRLCGAATQPRPRTAAGATGRCAGSVVAGMTVCLPPACWPAACKGRRMAAGNGGNK